MFFRRQSSEGSRWVSVVREGSVVHAAQVAYAGDGRPRVTWLWRTAGQELGASLRTLQAEQNLKGCSLVGVLDRAQYRMQATEALDIPRADWCDAMRWQLKEQVDFPVEDAVLDVLDMPHSTQLRQNSAVMVFIIPREQYTAVELAADDVGLCWQGLDVPETSLRNLCALTEEGSDKAQALVVFGEAHGMLVITLKGELLMARHIEVSVSAITGEEEGRGAALSRAALEILRTVDTFERMHSQVNLTGITVALPPGCTPDVIEMLSELIYVPLKGLELGHWFDLEALGNEAERLNGNATFNELCALGAALRGQVPTDPPRQHLQLLDPSSVLGQSPVWGAVLGVRLAGAMLALGTAAGLGLSATATAFNLKAANMEAEVNALRITDASLPESPVVKELESLRQKNAQQRQMQEALQGSVAWSSQGYSDYLMALARQAQPGVWITGMALHGDGRDLVLSGRAANPASLPLYLQRLGQEEHFKGRKFAQMEIASVGGGDAAMGNGVVQFSLRSMLPAEKKERSDGSSPDKVMKKAADITSPDAKKRSP